MITAIDTNILLDVLTANEKFSDISAAALQSSATAGSLTVSDIVYVEPCIHFSSQRECDAFLEESRIRIGALRRGKRTSSWPAVRRRIYRKQGERRTRILPDFLIGAHAQTQATGLLSRGRGFCRELFSSLNLLDPSMDGPHRER